MKRIYINKYCFVLIYLFFVSVFSVNGQSYIPGGNVTGTWQVTGSPYYIQGEITIPNSETLTIEPGVKVVFMGHYKFNVQGRLLAIGTPKDTIYFTVDNTQTGWHGIRFLNTPETNDTSKIVFCSLRYGKANSGSGNDYCGGAIFIRVFTKVLVSNSLFEYNLSTGNIGNYWGGAAIYALGTTALTITKSIFNHNTGSGDCAILCYNSDVNIFDNIFSNNSGTHGAVFIINRTSIISGNIFYNNNTTSAGGALFNMTTNNTVKNNLIINNKCLGGLGEGGGIKCWMNDKSIIINNTIAYNSAATGGGICCNDNSDPVFLNNIIWGNSSKLGSQVSLVDLSSDPIFTYCDIQGGKEEFGGSGSGLNYSGIYESNFDLDPLFKDTASMDYNLSDLSLCIGKGVDSLEVLGNWYFSPQFDFNGNPRPGPAGSKPDLGAFESLLNNPYVGINQKLLIPNEVILYQNYPNPFNSKTKIQFVIPELSFVTLKVFDITGKQISCLVSEEKPAGTYEVTWHAGNLPGGVYFYQLNAGGIIETRKMILRR